MGKLEFITMSKMNDINLFLEKVENYTGIRLPISYATNSKIVGVFSQEKLIAGYMLVTRPSFRSLMFVPDQIKENNSFFENDSYEMMEVNGLWISPAVKSPKDQFRIWMKLIRDVFLAKKKFLLLMSDVRNKNIEYIHSLTNPEYIYEGAPQLMAGEDTHKQVRVAYTTRWRAILNLPKYWMELKSREARVSELLKKRLFAQSA